MKRQSKKPSATHEVQCPYGQAILHRRKVPAGAVCSCEKATTEKPLPQVWQITMYSEEEVLFAATAIAYAITQLRQPNSPHQMFKQFELQLRGLDTLTALHARLGTEGVMTLWKRFAAVGKETDNAPR